MMNAMQQKIISSRSLVALLVALVASGCDNLTVPNPNDASVDQLVNDPDPDIVAAAVQGLFRGARDDASEFVQFVGAFGREAYLMSQDGAELVGTVRNPLNGANFPGNTIWQGPYQNIRNANLVLDAILKVEIFTDEQRAAVRGAVKTVQAYEFMMVALTRDRFGVPIDVGTDPNEDPAPFESKATVVEFLNELLDEAASDLQNGGSSFPFGLTSGQAAFATPQTFFELNRALRARWAVRNEEYSTALSALSSSFLDTTAPLDFGAFHNFSTVAGDATNPLNRPNFIFAHPRLLANAQVRADGSLDLRAQAKLVERSPFSVAGITSNLNFTIYNSSTAPLAWIRNEELILLRAEANLGMGNLDTALEDINLIRTRSGGLEEIPVGSLNQEEMVTELLYNIRYSLMYEWGHTWLSMRNWDRLLDELLPVVTGADPLIVDVMPIPESECAPRDSRPEGCGRVPPLNS